MSTHLLPTKSSRKKAPRRGNEKYTGDALLQKTFTVDFLQKKKKANEGEVPQYYVENRHPAIVTEEVFDLVQHELRRRQEQGRHTSAVSIFSSRIVCGECGAYYGSKVWHSTDAYRSQIWRCNRKYETKGSPCPSPHLREEELKSAFVKTMNQVLERKEEIIETCAQVLATLNDTAPLEQKVERLQAEQDMVYGRIESLIHENAQVAQDQEAYNRRMKALYTRCEELKSSMAKVRSQIMDWGSAAADGRQAAAAPSQRYRRQRRQYLHSSAPAPAQRNPPRRPSPC